MKKILVIFFLISNLAYPHSGRTDRNGGHWNRKKGTYHSHRVSFPGLIGVAIGIGILYFISGRKK